MYRLRYKKSGLCADILDFWLPLAPHNIENSFVECLDLWGSTLNFLHHHRSRDTLGEWGWFYPLVILRWWKTMPRRRLRQTRWNLETTSVYSFQTYLNRNIRTLYTNEVNEFNFSNLYRLDIIKFTWVKKGLQSLLDPYALLILAT